MTVQLRPGSSPRDPRAQCWSSLSPGGRGQDGSPVITFPDYPAFGDVPDKDFQNVMTYLTSIPRCVWKGHSVVLQAELGPSSRKVGRPPPSPRPCWAVWHPGAEGRGADAARGPPLEGVRVRTSRPADKRLPR